MAKKYLKQYNLTTEQLTKNLEIFKKTQEKYKPYTDELIEYLADEQFFECPASTALSMNNCCPGGLLDNIIRTSRYAVDLNKLLPDHLQQEIDSIVKVCFIYSIGKVGMYEENDSKWHRETLGQMYNYKEDQEVVMRINEKSAYLAMKYGVKLEDYEYQAIVNQGKSDDDKQAKYFSDTLTIILKQAIQLSIIEEQDIFKKFQDE